MSSRDIHIDPTAKIECDELVIGDGTTIRAHAEIYGTRVVLGPESFIDEYAVIGGGSAGELTTGAWFHLGMFAQINTARPVTIGEEVGVGIGSRVFTHGAYLSELDGFPVSFESVTIGDRVWIPNAIIMPGVTIENDVVVAAGSVVSRDLPMYCLAGGTPAKVLKEKAYPQPVTDSNRFLILERIITEAGVLAYVSGPHIICGTTVFDTENKTVEGVVTASSEKLRNQLRRSGIRFRVWAESRYEPW